MSHHRPQRRKRSHLSKQSLMLSAAMAALLAGPAFADIAARMAPEGAAELEAAGIAAGILVPGPQFARPDNDAG